MLLCVPLVVIFNIIRVVTTILLIVFLTVSVADTFHEIIFRLFLVIIVIGFYYLFLKRMIKYGYFQNSKYKKKTTRIKVNRYSKRDTKKKTLRRTKTNK